VGSVFILPALFFLVYDFQHKKIAAPTTTNVDGEKLQITDTDLND
jgi:hypothetical protein